MDLRKLSRSEGVREESEAISVLERILNSERFSGVFVLVLAKAPLASPRPDVRIIPPRRNFFCIIQRKVKI